MPVLNKIFLKDFRNYSKSLFEFNSPETLLIGANGRGKTNLLEAIYFLSVLRSFRGGNFHDLARLGTGGFELTAKIAGSDGPVTLDILQSGKLRRLMANHVPVKKSGDFIDHFRAVALVPEDMELTAGPSSRRRHFFDMLIALNSLAYRASLHRYLRALAERNAALKKNAPENLVRAYDHILAEETPLLCKMRQETTLLLETELQKILQCDTESLKIDYRPAAPPDSEEFLKQLTAELPCDRKRGFTRAGVQNDEFPITYLGRDLRSYGSNGQKRKIALFMRLAELALVHCAPAGIIALVDDVGGELDEENRARFFEALKVADQRIFTFATEQSTAAFPDAQKIYL